MENLQTRLESALKLHQTGELIEAEKLYCEILNENPKEGNVLNLLGYLKIQNNQFEDAISLLKAACGFYPNFFDAWFNLAQAYKNNKKNEDAIKAYLKASEINPKHSGVYFNLANIYEYLLNDTSTALEYYKKAYEYGDKQDADYNYFLGITYLKAKDFKNGLIHHEYRLSKNLAAFSQAREYKIMEAMPMWAGEDIRDKTIFVYYEAALGDTLMYARYLPLLKKMCKKVIFKCQIDFVEFFKENNFGIEMIDFPMQPSEVLFDTHISLMSIPYVLRHNTEQDIPFNDGYLKGNPQRIQEYKEKYFNNDKFKIGIKWKGSTLYDEKRAINIESFYKLFDLPDTQFYSVQKGEGIEELEKIPEKYNVVDLGSSFNDFRDTAAAIENMDLVICNDTSVAHLAGAMGKPCWILLPFVQNWRWCTDTSYSPWYKSVKLFKQCEPDNWDEVFERVLNMLRKFLPSPLEGEGGFQYEQKPASIRKAGEG